MLQWGRGHVTAESCSILGVNATTFPLQWGRGHVTAESNVTAEQIAAKRDASMGPRSRDRGIISWIWRPVRYSRLQWGRGHVTAESNVTAEQIAAKRDASM